MPQWQRATKNPPLESKASVNKKNLFFYNYPLLRLRKQRKTSSFRKQKNYKYLTRSDNLGLYGQNGRHEQASVKELKIINHKSFD